MIQVLQTVDQRDAQRQGLLPWKRPFLALGEELDMRVDPRDLLSVVFLCEDRKPEHAEQATIRRPVATAFFVRVKSEDDPAVSFDYIVTGRHVIRDDRTPDTLWVRVNRRDRKPAHDGETQRLQWRVHESADVAAILSQLPMPDATNQLEYRCIPLEDFVGPGPQYGFEGGAAGSTGTKAEVGLGDELFAPGLFIQDSGGLINLPVARFGRVARMPGPVNVEIGYSSLTGPEKQDVIAYLTEFLSWGGFSGSPVFWYYPIHPLTLPEQRGTFRALLGLVTGHYFIQEGLVTLSGDVPADEELRKLRARLNSGIAIVTPAEAVRELLLSPAFVEERHTRLKKINEQRGASIQMDKNQASGG